MLPPWAVALAFALKSGGGVYIHAERLLAKAGGSKCKVEGYPPPSKRSASESGKGEGLHKRSAEDWGDPLTPRGDLIMSVLGTCFTKQTGDMVYTMAENSWLSQLWLHA